MSAHNWVFLRQEDDFEANFELLIDALDTDLAYIREHTRLLTLAIEWDKNGRRDSATLRGQELIVAEGWLAQSGSKDPPPANLHQEYLTSSRAIVSWIQRLIYSALTLAFTCLFGLSVFSYIKSNQAETARQEAENTARIATSKSLVALVLTEVNQDPELSILLALQSIKTTYQQDKTILPLSNSVLRESIIKSKIKLTLRGHGKWVMSVAYSADGQRIVTTSGSGNNTAKVWDAQTGKELLTLTGHNNWVYSVAYSPDGQRIVTASWDKTAKVWTLRLARNWRL